MEGISSLLNFLLNLIWRYLHCFIHVMLYIERLILFAWHFICIFNCTTTNPDTVIKISAIVSTVVVWCGLAALWQEEWPRKKHRISTLSVIVGERPSVKLGFPVSWELTYESWLFCGFAWYTYAMRTPS